MVQNIPVKGRFKAIEIEELPYDAKAFKELRTNKIIFNITHIDDQYIMFARVGNNIRASNVTRMMEAQQKMLRIFAILLIVFSIWTYLISLLFVKSGLRNIKQLVRYVQNMDIHNLHKPVPLSWPKDDEIRIIWSTLQETLTTIKEQTDSLKDFVTHTSHELKTPLMSLSAVIDAGQKTGEYEKSFVSAKEALHNINKLFDTLLAITKWEYHTIAKKRIDIIPLIKTINTELKEQYTDKDITYTMKLPKSYHVHSHQEIFRIIFLNILQNAYKYTNQKWVVQISLQKDVLSITNSWAGIDAEHIKHIWDKFWKNHQHKASKDGFGLWLYLVKLLANKHGWKLAVQSNKKTTFSIWFTA